MRLRYDLAGQRFGRLVVLRLVECDRPTGGGPAWVCKCDCGAEKTVLGQNLRYGKTISCGCVLREFMSALGRSGAGRRSRYGIELAGAVPSSIRSTVKSDYVPRGTLSNGYRTFSAPNRQRVREHVVVAERALGKPLPKGAVVHHVDENRLNNAPTNLVICPSNAYHRLIHRRMKALDACGHASWVRCDRCRQYGPPEQMKLRLGEGNLHIYRHINSRCGSDT